MNSVQKLEDKAEETKMMTTYNNYTEMGHYRKVNMDTNVSNEKCPKI